MEGQAAQTGFRPLQKWDISNPKKATRFHCSRIKKEGAELSWAMKFRGSDVDIAANYLLIVIPLWEEETNRKRAG